jgi:hypothetical protein
LSHDQVFKELLRAFFREFLELFFPEVAARLDFDRVTFLDREMFTDLPEGSVREPDLVAQTTTLSGEPELILLHVEVQAQREREFPYRMYEYYALLRLRFKLPVFPIVLYLAPGSGGLTEETYHEALFGRNILTFHYATVGLPDLSADDYRERDNPLGPALSALMQPSRSGRALQKASSLQRVFSGSLDEARKSLLAYVIETYLTLNLTEQDTFRRMIAQESLQEAREMLNIYEERGVARGIVKGKRDMLRMFLTHKFGPLPEAVEAKLQNLETEAELDALSEQVLDADSLEAMGLLEQR